MMTKRFLCRCWCCHQQHLFSISFSDFMVFVLASKYLNIKSLNTCTVFELVSENTSKGGEMSFLEHHLSFPTRVFHLSLLKAQP